MFFSSTVLLLAISTFVGTSTAHMLVKTPPSLGYKGNPFVSNIDYSLNSPLSPTGSNFPCKGYHLDISRGAGKSVATWPAGSSQSFTIEGSAWHSGGSCQASLSYDNGRTFKVIKSFIGVCPIEVGGTWQIQIPSAAPSGDALFAWTWFNKIGNREMYMSCSVVTITNGGGGISNLPDILVAQLSGLNSCTVPEGQEVEFPNPGPVVQRAGTVSTLPRGDCTYPSR